MTIKPSKSHVIYLIVFPLLFSALFALLLSLEFGIYGLFAGVILYAVLFLIFLRIIFVNGRTIIMDEKGCVVKFMCFKKTYLWSELNTKRIFDCSCACNGQVPYKRGVVFSKRKKIRFPSFWTPSDYAIKWGNPFSFFFLYFKPTDENRKNASPFTNYYMIEISEEMFLVKMKEWGITLTYED